MKLTEWYPAKIKPVHVGWYHTKANENQKEESPFNWWWDGIHWRVGNSLGSVICSAQHRIWRGLTEPHHGS